MYQTSSATPSPTAAVPARLTETLAIDFVQLIDAPYVQQVLGCIDQYFATSGLQDEPEMTVSSTPVVHHVSVPMLLLLLLNQNGSSAGVAIALRNRNICSSS